MDSLKKKTAKGLFWGGIGNGMIQMLNLFFGIILARILSASDYGMVGMLAIFSQIAGSIQEFGFTNAIVNKKDISDIDYNSVFWFSITCGLCSYIILFFLAPFIADFYHQEELILLARFVFLGFVISSIGTAFNAYFFRNMMVKQRITSQVIALCCSGIIGICMAFYGMSYWSIAIQSNTYIFITLICYWHYSPWHPTIAFSFGPIKEMLPFGIKILITNVFSRINENIFTVLLGRFFSSSQVGFYTQAYKWNNMGGSFTNGMISSVSQPVLSKVKEQPSRLQQVFRKILRFTAFVSFPSMLGLAFVAHELILITISDKWLPCVPLLQILCIWGAFLPISSLYINLLFAKGKSNIYMWNTIALGVTQVISLIFTYQWGIIVMLSFWVSINILWVLIWHFYVWREIRLSFGIIITDVSPFIFVSVITLFLTHLIIPSSMNIYLMFVLKILLAVIIYCLIMYLLDAKIMKESLNYLSRNKNITNDNL
jgi:O-antigen/teichoic acid export membrane protein